MPFKRIRKMLPHPGKYKAHLSYHRAAQDRETSRKLLEYGKMPIADVLTAMETTLEGLTDEAAEERLREVGPNVVAPEQHESWIACLLRHFSTPINLLLITVAVLSFFSDPTAGVIVAAMVLISVCIGFFQELRSDRAIEALQEMVTTTATVYRLEEEDGASRKQEIPIDEIVPGDILQLSAGDMIPADVRLASAKDLLVTEASLTGESLPVEKEAYLINAGAASPFEMKNLCFMGANVVSGAAIAVALTTGPRTYFGAIGKELSKKRQKTAFDKGITSLSVMLMRFMLVMVGIIFLVNGIDKGDWVQAFMFALSVAIGLTPGMLPMIVATNLARGALAMSRKKVIVKRLHSIQDFGAMNILCTDKTGTLTQNRIILEKHMDIYGEEHVKTLRYAYLNSFYQTGLKNLLDEAVLRHADELSGEFRVMLRYAKVDEIPFDFERRRMSVIVERDQHAHLLICKGAVEEIFKVCDRVEDADGELSPIDESHLSRLREVAADLNEDGFRVLAIAYREFPPERVQYGAADESGLILLGYVSFLDPPKETAPPALAALRQYGVQVKILTGDNERVTRKVCRDVDLKVDGVVLGPEVDAMDDEALTQAAERATVFAKLTPAHKERVIRALRSRGHVVGFLGDGINDAPAMRAADVGISVDDAVDIAKESADIVLLEKSLQVLEEGVLEGRRVFGNILKYIRMATSSNFGNMVSVVGASFLLPFLPMLPIHILIQNLLYDFSQTALPFDSVDEEYLAQPRKWELGNIARFMTFFGPVSSIFDYATFAVMWFALGANTVGQQSLFQTGWFIEGLLSQTLIIHMIRTKSLPFVRSWASPPLLLMTALIMGVGLWIPFSPLAPYLGMTAPPPAYFGWLTLILTAYCLLTQIVKLWFARRFGYN